MIGQQTWSLLHTCKEFRLGTSPEIRLFQKKSQVIPLDDQKKEGHGKKNGENEGNGIKMFHASAANQTLEPAGSSEATPLLHCC